MSGDYAGGEGTIIAIVLALPLAALLIWVLALHAWVLLQAIDWLILRPGAWLIGLIPERAGFWIGTIAYSVIAGTFVIAFYGLAIFIAVGGLL